MRWWHTLAWFAVGALCGFLWKEGAELRRLESQVPALSAEVIRCHTENAAWEKLVQGWGSEQGKCEAVVDFNHAMDVLEKESAAQKGKKP